MSNQSWSRCSRRSNAQRSLRFFSRPLREKNAFHAKRAKFSQSTRSSWRSWRVRLRDLCVKRRPAEYISRRVRKVNTQSSRRSNAQRSLRFSLRPLREKIHFTESARSFRKAREVLGDLGCLFRCALREKSLWISLPTLGFTVKKEVLSISDFAFLLHLCDEIIAISS